MFIVAISPLMFSPGDDIGVFKLAGMSADPSLFDGPGALVAEGKLTASLLVLSLAELGEDDVEGPLSVCAKAVPLCGLDLFLLLRFLLLPLLLG